MNSKQLFVEDFTPKVMELIKAQFKTSKFSTLPNFEELVSNIATNTSNFIIKEVEDTQKPKKEVKPKKVVTAKAPSTKAPSTNARPKQLFLPYNGEECVEGRCTSLVYDCGLFVQCRRTPKGDNEYCGNCQLNADKNGGTPDYGTIEDRYNHSSYFDYVDNKGRKQVPYALFLQKSGFTREEAEEYAEEQGVEIDERHFDLPYSIEVDGVEEDEKYMDLKNARKAFKELCKEKDIKNVTLYHYSDAIDQYDNESDDDE